MDIPGPTWLTVALGGLMLVAALYAAGRIFVAWRTKRATDYEVDAHHILMGVSMAGMLIPALNLVSNGPSAAVWLIVWIIVTVWFGVSVIRSAARGTSGRFRGHHLPHLIMSAAMVYMFSVVLAGPIRAGDMAGMPGVSLASSLPPWPTLDGIFLVFMAIYAVLVVDRFPLLAPARTGEGRGESTSAIAPSIFLAPRAAGMENVLMAVVMCFMLGTMLV